MGIELPTPNSLEQQPVHESLHPFTQENAPLKHVEEKNTTQNQETKELISGAGAGDSSGPSAQPVVSVTTDSSFVPQPAISMPLDDIPVVAADEDLIEKQWVDAAKNIVAKTRSDPYEQGQAISRLQADYLHKRYGKVVKVNSET